MSIAGLSPSAADDFSDLSELDETQTLRLLEDGLVAQHHLEVGQLLAVQHWAGLNSAPPEPVLTPPTTLTEWEAGRDRLVQVGGEGTPMVRELPMAELAIARRIAVPTAQRLVADVLDLAHRLPGYWAALRSGHGTVWVGRRIASMSRHLPADRVGVVDAAVTKAVEESPGRVLRIAEAAILRADPVLAREREAERRRGRGVFVGQSDEDGLKSLYARTDAGDVIFVDATVERIADAIQARTDLLVAAGLDPEDHSRDELRAEAFGWLARPGDVSLLLAGGYPVQDLQDLEQGEDLDEGEQDGAEPLYPTGDRPSPVHKAVLHVHVSGDDLDQADSDQAEGVARVEELGPVLLEQLSRLVGHSWIELKPVIDLNRSRSVNGYEHPPDVAERAFLITTGDVFPHAAGQSRRVDNDHPIPYDPGDESRAGPPGQTGDHNIAPLGRRHHRAKTHLRYQHHQLAPGRYLWRTPHGLWRLVDPTGTHAIDDWTAQRLLAG